MQRHIARLTILFGLLTASYELGRAPGLVTEGVTGDANTPSRADGTALRGVYKVVNVGTSMAFATARGSRDNGGPI